MNLGERSMRIMGVGIYSAMHAESQRQAGFGNKNKVAKAIKKVIPCQKVGLTVIGLEVPHAHIHLVPISKESDIHFGSQRLKLNPEIFSETANLISSCL